MMTKPTLLSNLLKKKRIRVSEKSLKLRCERQSCAPIQLEEFGNRVERREERKNQKIDDIATSKGISIIDQLEYETLYADEQYKVTIQPMSSRQSMFTFDEHGSAELVSIKTVFLRSFIIVQNYLLN